MYNPGFAEVFNNSMLAVIETPENSGWLSGLGYGVGYIAGLIALILFLIIFVWPGGETESLYGLNTSESSIDISFLLIINKEFLFSIFDVSNNVITVFLS